MGGGVGGLLCAIELTSNGFSGNDILILEKNDRVGKKLISTGNGQGNLFNRDNSAKYYHGDKAFIQTFCNHCDQIDLEQYLFRLGIPTCYESNGRAYPLCKQASAVLDILREILSKRGVNTLTNSQVTSITKKERAYRVCVGKNEYLADNVVLAFGGAVGKQFGTDGSSFELLKSLSHTVTPLYPSLVQLKTSLENIRGLKGLKERAEVTVLDGDKAIASSVGDLLFTDFGVSGSAVFQISSYVKGLKNPRLKISFLPDLSLSKVQEIIEYRENLEGIGQDKLIGLLVKRIGQTVQKTAKSLKAKDLAFALKNFMLEVKGDLGFNYAQVTKGGVRTSEVDANTFESKINKNLYLIGELLDVDGDCGGYNLTFAFVSGITCAKTIKGEK